MGILYRRSDCFYVWLLFYQNISIEPCRNGILASEHEASALGIDMTRGVNNDISFRELWHI